MRSFPILFAVAALVATPIFAQQPEQRRERPYRGVFGGGVPAEPEELLTASASIGTGFDTSVVADAVDAGFGGGTGVTGQRTSHEGGFALFSEGLSYSLSKTRASVGGSAFAAARYYPTLNDSWISNYGGSVGAGWSPNRRTRFSVGQSFSYQPVNLFSLFPEFQELPLGQTSPPDLDYTTLGDGYYTMSSQAGFSRSLSSRATFTTDYEYTRSDFATGYPDYSSQAASARFTRFLAAGFGLRFGYGYTQANYSDGQRSIGRHLIDTGLDYSRTLSFSRRTRLSFSTGATATKDQIDVHYTVIGNAHLGHEIGRTWSLSAAYDRNVGFVETLAAPFIYDSAVIGLHGLIGRSLRFTSAAGASLGHVGFGTAAGNTNDLATYYGSAGLAKALNRHLSLNLDYSYYRYGFNQTASLPFGFNTDLNRHSIRASLNAWVPILEHGRRGDATR